MPVGRLLSLAVVVCVSIAPARAQRYGDVFGKIVDSSQGGVSDASITVVDEDTGFRRTAQSETGGAYAVGSRSRWNGPTPPPAASSISTKSASFRSTAGASSLCWS